MRWLETELDGSGGSCGPALPGEVWTAPAGRRYASHACGGTIFYAVLFLDFAASDLPASKRGMQLIAGVRDAFLHQAVRRLLAAIREADDVSEMQADSLGEVIRAHLGRVYAEGNVPPVKAPARPALSANAARQLREFIYENLAERITLDGLARLAGMTPHHLLIAFRRAFGTTPTQYVIRQRLRQAQRRLEKPGRDITAIALDTGFSSHSHLTACFGRLVGCSPGAFRLAAGASDGVSCQVNPSRSSPARVPR